MVGAWVKFLLAVVIVIHDIFFCGEMGETIDQMWVGEQSNGGDAFPRRELSAGAIAEERMGGEPPFFPRDDIGDFPTVDFNGSRGGGLCRARLGNPGGCLKGLDDDPTWGMVT